MNLIHKAQWDEVDVFFSFFRKVIEAYHFQVRLHVTLILILVYAFEKSTSSCRTEISVLCPLTSGLLISRNVIKMRKEAKSCSIISSVAVSRVSILIVFFLPLT